MHTRCQGNEFSSFLFSTNGTVESNRCDFLDFNFIKFLTRPVERMLEKIRSILHLTSAIRFRFHLNLFPLSLFHLLLQRLASPRPAEPAAPRRFRLASGAVAFVAVVRGCSETKRYLYFPLPTLDENSRLNIISKILFLKYIKPLLRRISKKYFLKRIFR